MTDEKRVPQPGSGFVSHAPQGRPAIGPQPAPAPAPTGTGKPQPERGGPSGLEPTRYGDWERNGRCSDF